MSGTVAGNPWRISDRSGQITTGGTAQVLLAANSQRRGFWVQNLSDADLWINDLGVASAARPGIRLVAGALYEAPASSCPTAEISIFGANTAQSFSAREW